MPKRFSIGKRRSKALPALGFAGMSLSMASGACASTSEASANTAPPSQKHEIYLGEEEISDVSLATFHIFDKENAGPPPLFQKLRLAAGCGACGACSCAPCAYWPQSPQPPKATQPTQHRKKKPPRRTDGLERLSLVRHGRRAVGSVDRIGDQLDEPNVPRHLDHFVV